MRKLAALYLFLIVHSVVLAQDDVGNWDMYMAQYEKGAGSTIINMSLKTKAPDKSFRFLVSTGVHFDNCTAEGFPSETEFQKLYAVSDSVKRLLNNTVSNIMAGTFTYQCERKDYYYVKDTINLRQKLSLLYTKQFSQYQSIINIREDAAWEAYLSFLYPNEETMEYMRNQKVVMKLQEAGDKLEKKRTVDHWLYFPTIKARDSFVVFAQTNGFKIESTQMTDNVKSFELHISRIDKVDLTSISQLTLLLNREAQKYNGDYDGWETAVIR